MGGTDVKLAIFSCDKFWGDKTMKLKTLIVMSVMAVVNTSVAWAETVDQIGVFVPVNSTGQTATGSDVRGSLSTHDLGIISSPSVRNFAIVYEDFTFISSGVINSISWVGFYDFDTPGSRPVGGPDFQVNFYTSLGTNAASAIPTPIPYNLVPAQTSEQSLGVFGTGLNAKEFFRYTATGVTPFNVNAGTTYFTSIIAPLDFGINGWSLAFSNIGNDFSVRDFQADGDPTVLRQPSDMIDYAISITAVPEPGSVLAIFAVTGLVAVRRRRVIKKLFLIGE